MATATVTLSTSVVEASAAVHNTLPQHDIRSNNTAATTAATVPQHRPTPSLPPPACPYIVLALGSCYLRYGFCDEFQPRSKPMVVACRNHKGRGRANGTLTDGEKEIIDRRDQDEMKHLSQAEAFNDEDEQLLSSWQELGRQEYSRLTDELASKRVKPVSTTYEA